MSRLPGFHARQSAHGPLQPCVLEMLTRCNSSSLRCFESLCHPRLVARLHFGTPFAEITSVLREPRDQASVRLQQGIRLSRLPRFRPLVKLEGLYRDAWIFD